MSINTEKFARKPFYVDAIQVTEENMQEVAKWCDGTVEGTDAGENFIKVRVHRPLNERQTKAFVNDWILYAGSGYKIYTPKAFNHSFERVEAGVVKHIYRDAKSGELTTEAYAAAHPDTTVRESVKK
jgi:hypothetical protein